MNQESRLLICGLRRAVASADTSVSVDVDWRKFYTLAKSHGITALVWSGLEKEPAVQESMPEPWKQQFSADFLRCIFRDSQFEHVKGKIREGLRAAQVPHIFLKGSRLKNDYPVPALRTMCDMDILVNTADYDAIDQVAEGIGGKSYYGDGNHHNFEFPGGVAIEFHPNLVHPGMILGTEMNPGWQYARQDEQTKLWEMTPEGLYLHTLVHLAEHFAGGGVGVRFVLDIWILRHRSEAQPDRVFVEKELKRMSLLDFAQKIEALAEWWFGDGQSSPLLEELGEYILTSGSHGKSNRAMLNAVSLSKGGSRASALLQKAFYPRQELETRYPWCEGKPWLLPAAWCARAWGAVTKRGHLIQRWSEGTGQVSKEEVALQREKMARFGIQRKK